MCKGVLNMKSDKDSCDLVKKRINISIPEDLIEWIDMEVEENYRFENRSHFLTVLIEEYKKNKERV